MSVRIVGFGGRQTLEVSDGATVQLVCEEAGISPEASVALNGEQVSPEERDATPVRDEDTLVHTPPKVSQGR